MITRRHFLRTAVLSLLALLPWPRFLRPRPRPSLAEATADGGTLVCWQRYCSVPRWHMGIWPFPPIIVRPGDKIQMRPGQFAHLCLWNTPLTEAEQAAVQQAALDA